MRNRAHLARVERSESQEFRGRVPDDEVVELGRDTSGHHRQDPVVVKAAKCEAHRLRRCPVHPLGVVDREHGHPVVIVLDVAESGQQAAAGLDLGPAQRLFVAEQHAQCAAGNGLLELVAPDPQRLPCVLRAVDERLQQRRLAHARLALDNDHLRPPVPSMRERVLESSEFSRAADEFVGCGRAPSRLGVGGRGGLRTVTGWTHLVIFPGVGHMPPPLDIAGHWFFFGQRTPTGV